MSRSSEEVVFSVVGVRRPDGTLERPSSPEDRDPGQQGAGGLPTRRSASALEQEALPFEQERSFDADRFPLAGPILESSTTRELKGRCSQCETRLRLQAKGPGVTTVRCPVCGHARQVQL